MAVSKPRKEASQTPLLALGRWTSRPRTMRKYGSAAEATLPVATGYVAGRADWLVMHPALP